MIISIIAMIIMVATMVNAIEPQPFSQHLTPIGLVRPTDPNEFWIELDLPQYFVPGMYNNITFSLWNFEQTSPIPGALAFQLLSTSSTFSYPLLQPSTTGGFCFDDNGRVIANLRSQFTNLDLELRLFPAQQVIPFFKFTCNLFAFESVTPNNDADSFIFRRYTMTQDGTIQLITSDNFRFKHPPTKFPEFSFYPVSLSHAPGGFETRFAIYINAAGTLDIGSLTAGSTSMGIKKQVHLNTKHTDNFTPVLSDDFYGRVDLDFVDDKFSQDYLDKINVKDGWEVEKPGQQSTVSTFCYFLSNDDLVTNASSTVPIIDLDDWSDLPKFYQRSAVWNAFSLEEWGLADVYFQMPGTHVCSLFMSRGFRGVLELTVGSVSLKAVAYLPAIHDKISPSKRYELGLHAMGVTKPYWFIKDSSPRSISFTYRLPTFQRGDLIVVSKNSFNSTQFPTLPWYVDTAQPSTPATCLPFSLGGTHLAWINLPDLYQTGIGSRRYAEALDCTVNLHMMPGHFQAKIDLVFQVLPRESVPYLSPAGYEKVRSYADLFAAIDIKKVQERITGTIADGDAKGGEKETKKLEEEVAAARAKLVRILSANIDQSHFYTLPSEQIVGDMDIRDVLNVDFDVFKPEDQRNAASQVLREQNTAADQVGFKALAEAHEAHLALEPQPRIEGQSKNYSVVVVNDQKGGPHQNQNDQTTSTSPFSFFTLQQSGSAAPTAPAQPAFSVKNFQQKGYRSATVTITPVDMAISGGSLFDPVSNAAPRMTLPDIISGTTVPANPAIQVSRASPTQPLSLVFDLEYSWLEPTADYDLSVFCYYFLNGQPTQLKIAWGKNYLYSDHKNSHQNLFVQLPTTPANTAITVRCQFPLPPSNLRYEESRFSYYLQPGTVLELHALDLYSSYTKTQITSEMALTKLVTDSKSTTSPVQRVALPQALISGHPLAKVSGKRFKYKKFQRDQALGQPKFNKAAPVELVTTAGVSFLLDYGLKFNPSGLQSYIDHGHRGGLSDFILHAAHLNRFAPTNANSIVQLGVSTFPFSDPLYPITRSDLFTFYVLGELKTATVNVYDELAKTALKVFYANKALMSQLPTITSPEQLFASLKIVSIQPYYGLLPYQSQSFPNRLDILSYGTSLGDNRPPVTLNGLDSTFDQTWVPTRLAVSIAWVPSPSGSSPQVPLPSSLPVKINMVDSYLYQFSWEAGQEWNRLFAAGETQFKFEGIQPISAWTNLPLQMDCVMTPDFNSSYIKLGPDGDYVKGTAPVGEREIACGGTCDLLCPDSYRCKRHSDCYHGHCSADGICGAPQVLNIAMAKKSGAFGTSKALVASVVLAALLSLVL